MRYGRVVNSSHPSDDPLITARIWRARLQRLIAYLILLVLALKILCRAAVLLGSPLTRFPGVQDVLLSKPALTIVGIGLGYSAAVDLAYMLFTPGPDEAIQPLLVGLAASALIAISDGTIDWIDVAFVPVACLSMGFLLYLKRRFAAELNDEEHQPANHPGP